LKSLQVCCAGTSVTHMRLLGLAHDKHTSNQHSKTKQPCQFSLGTAGNPKLRKQ
jgi:hypothetical protein